MRVPDDLKCAQTRMMVEVRCGCCSVVAVFDGRSAGWIRESLVLYRLDCLVIALVRYSSLPLQELQVEK